MKLYIYILFPMFIFSNNQLTAQKTDSLIGKKNITSNITTFFTQNTETQIRGLFSIGGSTPIGLPAQIREIKSYQPTLQLGLEVNLTKWFMPNRTLGIRTGLRLEGRGMKTDARVKNYYTQLSGEEGKQTTGYFTGSVVTKMKNSYITIPILVTYRVNNKLNTYAGLYFSGIIDRDFTGYVYDGTLREGTPIGIPMEFHDDARGDYDFSEDLNAFQWGAQLGLEYQLRPYLKVFSDVNWGFNNLFHNNFEAISFNMYNIYANVGFAYNF